MLIGPHGEYDTMIHSFLKNNKTDKQHVRNIFGEVAPAVATNVQNLGKIALHAE